MGALLNVHQRYIGRDWQRKTHRREKTYMQRVEGGLLGEVAPAPR